MTRPERREQLLDVTREIAGEQGFHSVSIEVIARRAGITRPVVYEHFGDLSGLLEAMLARETARALAQLASVLPEARDEDTGAALLAAFRGYLEAVSAEPLTWRLVLMPQEGAPAMLREQIGVGRDAVVAVLAEVLQPELAPGLVSPDPALTARLLSALADEAARLLLTQPGEFPLERLLAHAEWLLGCLTRPG